MFSLRRICLWLSLRGGLEVQKWGVLSSKAKTRKQKSETPWWWSSYSCIMELEKLKNKRVLSAEEEARRRPGLVEVIVDSVKVVGGGFMQ
ncbi:hypothetical protein RJT34_28862 [Clitoria ternatea]|uniref:Uncharacterized protein n=1 Tax=Clitoria ternatea TaxID=43366 RepID=A0AAN9FFI2_CLITE